MCMYDLCDEATCDILDVPIDMIEESAQALAAGLVAPEPPIALDMCAMVGSSPDVVAGLRMGLAGLAEKTVHAAKHLCIKFTAGAVHHWLSCETLIPFA